MAGRGPFRSRTMDGPPDRWRRRGVLDADAGHRLRHRPAPIRASCWLTLTLVILGELPFSFVLFFFAVGKCLLCDGCWSPHRWIHRVVPCGPYLERLFWEFHHRQVPLKHWMFWSGPLYKREWVSFLLWCYFFHFRLIRCQPTLTMNDIAASNHDRGPLVQNSAGCSLFCHWAVGLIFLLSCLRFRLSLCWFANPVNLTTQLEKVCIEVHSIETKTSDPVNLPAILR